MIASSLYSVLPGCSSIREGQSAETWIGPVNIIPFEKQVAAIAALAEGCSIRSTERLLGVHRDTVMRLSARIGTGCARLHDAMMRDLNSPIIQIDELWSFIGKKQKRLTRGDAPEKGDCYVFIGLDSINKAILSYRTGKRDGENAVEFLADLRSRVLGSPIVSSDSFSAYEGAIRQTFGEQIHYGQITKRYVGEPPINAARRYSPGVVVAVEKRRVRGFPPEFLISTSHAERQNLSLRMSSRRFTRLTNAYSKTLTNHAAAVSLYVAHYNLCRPHEALDKATPAMELGLTDHPWSIAELIEAATATETPEEPQGRQAGRFRIINGGLS